MHLPTCPACGQSVLDDDAESCPFCGAAMDGSSGATKASLAPGARAQKTAASAKKDNPAAPATPTIRRIKSAGELAATDAGDVFDTGPALPTRQSVKCAPRRTKSRTLKVVCPMCDTPGFIPPAAAGRTVRCCNTECMVPLFTAPGPNTHEAQRKPSQPAEDAIRQEEQLVGTPKSRSPMLMYGVLGGVLLVLGVGLKFYFDRDQVDPNLAKPLELNIPSGPENSAEAVRPQVAATNTPAAETNQSRATVVKRLLPQYQAASVQISRDKAFCRREKADALLRIGEPEAADREFDQLLVVSENREPKDYYRIEPRIRRYWTAWRNGDAAAAQSALALAAKDAATIPPKGLLAVRARIVLAAAYANESAFDRTAELLHGHDYDRTIRAEQDDLHRAAWISLAVALNENGIATPSPLSGLTWSDPLTTVAAAVLTAHGQTNRAVEWANQQSDSEVRSDALAVIAAYAPESRTDQALIDAAKAVNADTALRIRSILAKSDPGQLESIASNLLSGDSASPADIPNPGEMMDFRPPDLSATRMRAWALSEFAIAAAAHQRNDDAVKAVDQLFRELTQALAPTAVIRNACIEMDQSERAIHSRIRTHLGLPASRKVEGEFRRYRTGLDRLGRAAEERRLFLVQLLSSVAESDGGRTISAAIGTNEALATELQVDSLCQFIVAAAIQGGGNVEALSDVTDTTIPVGSRIDPLAENEIATLWRNVVQNGGDREQLAELESVHRLPGLRSCLLQRMFERRANEGDISVLDAVADLGDDVCRENSLWSVAAGLTRSDLRPAVESWLKSERLSATERVLILSGIISGLPAENDSQPGE